MGGAEERRFRLREQPAQRPWEGPEPGRGEVCVREVEVTKGDNGGPQRFEQEEYRLPPGVFFPHSHWSRTPSCSVSFPRGCCLLL